MKPGPSFARIELESLGLLRRLVSPTESETEPWKNSKHSIAVRQECSGHCRTGGSVVAFACGNDAGGDDDNDNATGPLDETYDDELDRDDGDDDAVVDGNGNGDDDRTTTTTTTMTLTAMNMLTMTV